MNPSTPVPKEARIERIIGDTVSALGDEQFTTNERP